MSKTMNYFWDCAEKESDAIINDYVNDKITIDTAKDLLSNVENIELCGIDEHNVDEVLFTAKDDYLKKGGVNA